MKTSLKNAELVNTVIRKMMMIMFIARKEMENVNTDHINREKKLRGGKNEMLVFEKDNQMNISDFIGDTL